MGAAQAKLADAVQDKPDDESVTLDASTVRAALAAHSALAARVEHLERSATRTGEPQRVADKADVPTFDPAEAEEFKGPDGKCRIGIIGGSGLYAMEGVTDVREVHVETPFGAPSDVFVLGKLSGVDVVFLPRHGRGHRLTPSEVNYRANIFGMKVLGVQWIIAVTACGSLKEEVVPGHIVLPDQFIDRTKGRQVTFFEKGVVGHVQFASPICSTLRGCLLDACNEVGVTVHDGGAYLNMEGPAFSTIAESHMYRDLGGVVIGMTNLAEAKLAREAGISLATLAMATDYDCWHPDHDAVTVEQVIATFNSNISKAKSVLKVAVSKVAALGKPTPYADSMRGAIMTAPDKISAETKAALGPLLEKYL